ncbi:MAG: hypothetical protein ABSA93_25045 [Streptosporangiaceae bacterium]|jgi:hypothetical protein
MGAGGLGVGVGTSAQLVTSDTVSVSAVASTVGGIRLTIAKQEVHDLLPVDIDHPDLT